MWSEVMDYVIDLESIKKQYRYKEENESSTRITHTPPKRIKIFPFDTKFNNKFNSQFEGNFEGIISDFTRIVVEKIQKDKNDKNKIIEKMLEKIHNIPEERKIYLKDFFEEIFFHEDSLLFVHPKLVFRLRESDTKEIASYLVDVLLDGENKKKIQDLYGEENKREDVFTKVLLSSLEKLEDKKYQASYFGKLKNSKKIY